MIRKLSSKDVLTLDDLPADQTASIRKGRKDLEIWLVKNQFIILFMYDVLFCIHDTQSWENDTLPTSLNIQYLKNSWILILIRFIIAFCFLNISPSAAGGVFGPQGESGSEPEDDNQMKFYTEQHRGRRRSKGEEKAQVHCNKCVTFLRH